MVRCFRILGIFLVFIGIIALLPNQVSACIITKDNYLSIRINKATYLDYDRDGFEDDVVTIFTIGARNIEESWNGKIYVSCSLESPSGIIYNFEFNDKMECIYWYQFDNDLSIGRIEQYGLVWYNTASEAGLYSFSISAEGRSNDAPTLGYAVAEFDPPGGSDPGSPEIGFM